MKNFSLDVPPWVLRQVLGSKLSAAGGDLDAWSPVRRPGTPAGLLRRRLTAQPAPPDGCTLISFRLPQAARLDAPAFESACESIYDLLHDELESADGERHALRLWNFVPHILAPLGALEHRYMVFNAGRYRAVKRRLRAVEQVATASGVGHHSDDFLVHCLAGRVAGRAVENPRQVPAYLYSRRYGPLPPCFARATRLETSAGSTLLVGGTAAVRGEDSLYAEDLEGQLEETLLNLSALARGTADDCDQDPAPDLDGFRSVRAYYVRPEDRETVRRTLGRHLPSGTEIELCRADLCRPELLVEIEGVVVRAQARS